MVNNIKIFFVLFFCTIPFTNSKKYIADSLHNNKPIDTLNLTNKELTEIPNIADYKIKYLNLSNNNIEFYDESKLPIGLKEINLANNSLKGKIQINKNLKKINVSYNKIDTLFIKHCVDSVNASNNNLTIIGFDCFVEKEMSYLDISNNTQLSSELRFNPRLFKNINRNNIKNNAPLRWSFESVIID